MRFIKTLASGVTILMLAAQLFAPATGLAQDVPKKVRKKSTTTDGAADITAAADGDSAAGAGEVTTAGGKKRKKKAPATKMRAAGIGLIATGMKDAPSPGVFGFGGAFAYGLSRSLEVEASLLSFGYILDYADFDTTVEITDTALGADGIYRMPLSPSMALRGRGGLGMHMMSAKVSGTLASTGEIKAESKSILAINIGGGLEIGFGRFYIAADIRKPVLMDKLESVNDVSIIACGEAGMRF
jgi:hypothetical protein